MDGKRDDEHDKEQQSPPSQHKEKRKDAGGELDEAQIQKWLSDVGASMSFSLEHETKDEEREVKDMFLVLLNADGRDKS